MQTISDFLPYMKELMWKKKILENTQYKKICFFGSAFSSTLINVVLLMSQVPWFYFILICKELGRKKFWPDDHRLTDRIPYWQSMTNRNLIIILSLGLAQQVDVQSVCQRPWDAELKLYGWIHMIKSFRMRYRSTITPCNSIAEKSSPKQIFLHKIVFIFFLTTKKIY